MTTTRSRSHAPALQNWPRLMVGLVLALLSIPLLLSGLDWPLKIALWVLLVLLADEASGWMGYLALGLGAIPWLLPLLGLGSPGQELLSDWAVLFPLAFTGLFALLLVKHAGGPPMAIVGWPLLVAPFLLVRFLGHLFDDELSLPADPRYLPYLLGAAALAYGASLALHFSVRRRQL